MRAWETSQADRRQVQASGWNGLQVCFALLALTAVFMPPAEAGERISHALDHTSMASAYAGGSDLVTAYTSGMARTRLNLAGRTGETNLAVPLEPWSLRAEFRARTWRAPDGSLLQGFAGKGSFRLTVGDCVARLCAASECSDAGAPIYTCSDGRKRKMSVKDLTANFDGVAYRRLKCLALRGLTPAANHPCSWAACGQRSNAARPASVSS